MLQRNYTSFAFCGKCFDVRERPHNKTSSIAPHPASGWFNEVKALSDKRCY